MPRVSVVLAILLCSQGCGGRTLGDEAGASATTSPTTSPTTTAPPTTTSSTGTPPPPTPRTLAEFRAAVAGVWEGSISADAGAPTKPAERARLELAPDGTYVGTCVTPDPRGYTCTALPLRDRGVWRVDRLTAGYEGMGEASDGSDRVVLRRVRLSADAQRLEFDVPLADQTLHYQLTRVVKR